MNINQTEQLLKSIYEAHEAGVNTSILLHGVSGVGKSDTVKKVARDLEVGCIDLRLGTQEVGDLIGIPVSKEVNGEIITTHGRPEWFPAPNTKGFLFLDELNRAHIEVLQAIFQLILDRRMHTHVLPEGWIIVSAINPSGADYEVKDLSDVAFLRRFLHIAFEPESDEWFAYAKSKGIPREVLGFLQSNPGSIGLDSVEIPNPGPCPRQWSLWCKLHPFLDESLHLEVLTGLVGDAAATGVITYRENMAKPISGLQVLNNWYAVEDELRKQTENVEIELLNETAEEIAQILEDEEYSRDALQDVQTVFKFLQVLPRDMAMGLLKERYIHPIPLRKHWIDENGICEQVLNWVVECKRAAGLPLLYDKYEIAKKLGLEDDDDDSTVEAAPAAP